MFSLLSSAAQKSTVSQFAEEMPYLFAELDEQQRLIYLNPKFAAFFSMDASRALGRTMRQLLDDEGTQALQASFSRSLSGEVVRYERGHKLTDGRTRHLSVTLTPKRDLDRDAQRVTGLYFFAQDISDQIAMRQELRNAQRFADANLDSGDGVFWDWDFETDAIHTRGRWTAMNGSETAKIYQPAERLWGLVHADDNLNAREQFMDCANGRRQVVELEIRVRDLKNDWRWVRAGARVTERGAAGRAKRMSGTMRDIHRPKTAELVAQTARNRFQALVNLTDNWYWETDTQHRITLIEGSASYAGFDQMKQQAIGRTRWDLHKGALDDAGWQRHRAILDARKPFELVYQSSGVSGGNSWVEIKGIPDFDLLGAFTGYHGSGKDVTRDIESKQHIAYLAQHDMLTGLVNRDQIARMLDRAVAAAAEQAASVALIYFDIDLFKEINDTFGHNIGDAALREIALRFKRLVPPGAEVGRVGGDEFMVTLPNAQSKEQALRVAQQLAEAASRPMTLRHAKLAFTASAGVALFPDHGAQADLLMNQADMALAEAKLGGRNCSMLFAPEMRERATAARELETKLRAAIGAKEFTLAWQPRVSLSTGIWEGGEALLRWPEAQRLKIGIQQVIEVAESAGLIADIGLWVAEAVCNQLEAWQAQAGEHFKHFCGALNVSVHQLSDERLFSLLRERASRLMPNTLEIEITESTLLQDANATVLTLEGLRKLGIRIAMDDFGSGYSHFAQLRKLPIDVIKMDKSLVDDITKDPQARAVASAVRALGRGLGMEMVAEGVEDEGQAAALKEIGFEYGQGYLWQRPCPAPEMLTGVKLSIERAKIKEGRQLTDTGPIFNPLDELATITLVAR